ALMILGRRGKLTPTMLGKCLDMKKGSLTTLLASLENKNLIYRESDKNDRRKVWIFLTTNGENYVTSQMLKYENIVKQNLDSLEDEKLEDFEGSIKSVIDKMKKL